MINKKNQLFCLLIFCFIVLLFSCTRYNYVKKKPVTKESVEGLLIITSRACFFVPNGYCKYLEYDNSKNDSAKAILIDNIDSQDEINSLNPVYAQINILPNKDSSNVIVLLDKGFCRNDLLGENECQILSVTVALTTYDGPIELMTDQYVLKFKWEKHTYYYESITKGSRVYCNIISVNESQQKWILENKELPIGIVKKLND